ncbi:MAG: hypothetical protein H0U35_10195 [Sporichthyaceae bacterium]|nr:hypothetical protein [Sporichthyaceae bacterium]
MRDISAIGRHGRAALAVGPLLILSTGVELVHRVQAPDGTVVEPVVFALLIALWGIGMLCVGVAALDARGLHREAAAPLARAGRIGVRLVVAGSALQVLFAAVVAVSAAAAGKPVEASFVLFGLGFLLLVVGGVLLGVGVWRARVVPSGATPLWVGAAAALVAIVVFTDPWHDIGLFVFAGAWSALGVTLLTRASVPAERSDSATTRATRAA